MGLHAVVDGRRDRRGGLRRRRTATRMGLRAVVDARHDRRGRT